MSGLIKVVKDIFDFYDFGMVSDLIVVVLCVLVDFVCLIVWFY